jgi:hypothetical protein
MANKNYNSKLVRALIRSQQTIRKLARSRAALNAALRRAGYKPLSNLKPLEATLRADLAKELAKAA